MTDPSPPDAAPPDAAPLAGEGVVDTAPDSASTPGLAAADPPSPRSARHVGSWSLAGLAFLILAAGLAYVWQRHRAEATQLHTEVMALRARLDQTPATAPAVAALARQVAALAAHAAASQPVSAANPAAVSALTAQVQGLVQRDVLADRRAAVGATQLAAQARQLAALGQHVSALDDRIAALASQRASGTQATAADLAALRQSLATETAAGARLATQLQALQTGARRTARLARIAAARAALASGQPLGALPGASPALARFASTKPPTEAELRLAFPAAARAALAASRPRTAGQPLLTRLWTRVESLVTVRRGDRVILGDPAAGPLAAARARLAAGDLAGAVAALGPLDPRAAQAMADWRAQAQALLAARAALDAMSRSG